MDALCCASPRKAGGVPTGPLGSSDTKVGGGKSSQAAEDDDGDLSLTGRALSIFGGGKPKKKAEKHTADEEEDGDISISGRALSLFGGGKPKKHEGALPPNWKKAKDKDGKVYFFNSVTQVRQYTTPRFLPKGWTEALHKDSGRVYYVHKATRKTTFSFPTEADDDGADEDEDEDNDSQSGFLGKTLSFATGGMLGKKKKDDELGRTATLTKGDRTATLAKKKADTGGGGGGGEKKETTVFISCTTLIKEVKLCVDAKQHPPLDALLDNLVNRKISAEEAVKHLQTLVGTTLVQQAGMSVKNAKTGTLPHGWLEYSDERSGRSYYYNVHSRTTTWYKPKKDDLSDAAKAAEFIHKPAGHSEREEEHVQLDFNVDTHNVAMTGFI